MAYCCNFRYRDRPGIVFSDIRKYQLHFFQRFFLSCLLTAYRIVIDKDKTHLKQISLDSQLIANGTTAAQAVYFLNISCYLGIIRTFPTDMGRKIHHPGKQLLQITAAADILSGSAKKLFPKQDDSAE